MRRALFLALTVCAGAALAQDTVPSGLSPELFDMVIEAEAGIARFRFVLPVLATVGHDAVAADFQWLCDNWALPELAANGWTARSVIISISDREMALGTVEPAAVQFFEGFAITTGTCEWEPF